MLYSMRMLADSALESLFDATAEATEQAIVDALFTATTVTGFRGHRRYALREIAPDWPALAVQAAAR
jgi:D-aminopeptidase